MISISFALEYTEILTMLDMMNSAIMKSIANAATVVMLTILDARDRNFMTLLSCWTLDTPLYVATSAHT